eukprot:330199-Pyramimonas_sp.AAC.1
MGGGGVLLVLLVGALLAFWLLASFWRYLEFKRYGANGLKTELEVIAVLDTVILLRFTGPPVPITARMHSTPRRPFLDVLDA